MRKLPGFLVVAVAAVACSDSFKPTTETIGGVYELQTLTTDSAGVHRDLVAAGASLELMLAPGGQVIGELWLPVDTLMAFADMLGTWTLSGKTVHFTQNVDTFVRDMDWIASESGLSADKTFGSVRVRATLKR
ncbi:MAG: hypothetical protein DMD62_10755 [Gemmatimonadetes bacterium]|nr:MAG: hypothetical protein DMD62_10755 [Gemmatimonadota bacterium]